MLTLREKITLILLTAIYLLCGFRYFPDQPQKTFLNTAQHLLTTAPFIIGTLLITSSFVKKTTGEKLAVAKMIRFYLAAGIIIEFFLGLYNYLKINS